MHVSQTAFADVQVLTVDDSMHIREIIKRCLRGLSFGGIKEACDIEEAKQILKRSSIDLMLVDQLLGGDDGTELVDFVRNSKETHSPYVPIIMVTGFADKRRLDQAVRSGVNYVVAKPIRPKEIYDRIWKCIYEPMDFLKTECYHGPNHPYLFKLGAICSPPKDACEQCPLSLGEMPADEPEDHTQIMV